MQKKEEKKLQDEIDDEFEQSLVLLHNTFTELTLNDDEFLEQYLLFIEKQQENLKQKESPSLLMIITNGLDKLCRVKLDQEYLQEHRDKTGIEGSWISYMTLMKQALEQKNLNLTRNIKKTDRKSHNYEEEVILKVHYPLMVGARITGKFDLTEFEIRGRERHEIIQSLLFKMVKINHENKSKPKGKENIEGHKVEESIHKQFEQINISVSDHIDDGRKARKPKGTLVAPNIKRRKVTGAKF